jgi:hypothetical protein
MMVNVMDEVRETNKHLPVSVTGLMNGRSRTSSRCNSGHHLLRNISKLIS